MKVEYQLSSKQGMNNWIIENLFLAHDALQVSYS